MFGSIAQKSIDNRPPPQPANPSDPWDDTSLIHFWQQSIGSYKKHHGGPDTLEAKGPDPLVERSKRIDSSIPDEQASRTKRARKDNVDPSTDNLPPSYTSIPAQTAQNSNPLRQEPNEDDGDDVDQGPEVEEAKEEYGEEHADEVTEDQGDYYGESSYDYNYGYSNYAYQQPHPAPPPTMPFAPPPPASSSSPEGNGNEALTNMIMAWYYSGYYTGLYQTMKFAKQMETEATELPVNWRPYLIKYRSLKKSLHSVVEELQSRGLSLQLLSDQRQENWSLVYAVTGDTKNQPRPCIKIRVDNPASFSLDDDNIMHQVIPSLLGTDATDIDQPFQYQIDLIKDMEFLRLLLAELEQAVTLYDIERQRLLSAVKDLEELLTVAASPTKKDLYIWREIFHLYLSICPAEKSTQDYEGCKERLALLSNDIVKRKLDKKLSSCRSKAAFGQFFDINHQMNIFQHFQLLNTTAMTKILKKHDKRSGLTAMSEFPTFAKDNLNFLREIDAALFQIIRSKITTIVPQPDDYSCPVCYGITWRPIRLECNHVFCVRCLIKAHRKRLYDCPLCRLEMAVGNADANNLDKELQEFLLLYFPREIKEKRRDNEQEQADLVGAKLTGHSRRLPAYNNRTMTPFSPPHNHHSSNCSIM